MPCVYDRDGVQIYLYNPPEHPPPHVHVFARGLEGILAIETGALIAGKLKGRDLRYTQEVVAKHREALLQGFRDALAYKSPQRID